MFTFSLSFLLLVLFVFNIEDNVNIKNLVEIEYSFLEMLDIFFLSFGLILVLVASHL